MGKWLMVPSTSNGSYVSIRSYFHPDATWGCRDVPSAWQDDSRSRCSARSFLGPLNDSAPRWPRWVTRVRVGLVG